MMDSEWNTDDIGAPGEGRRDSAMIRTVIRGVGQTLFTLGLIILLFAAYEVYGKTWQIMQEKKRLDKVLDRQWNDETTEQFDVADGEPLVKMFIPALNKEWVVVQGTSAKDIKLAPGHYPQSQFPGQAGNFAVAGHRAPAIFWDLDKLDNDAAVIVESAQNYYIYSVYANHVVKPTDVWVIEPNADNSGDTQAKRKLLTLTTCHPKFDNYQRLVVHAELQSTQPKSEGKPKELT